jgi:hypothetical protein
MKCWTVTNEVRRGIKITKSDEEPRFQIDEESFLPVSSGIKELFEERAGAITAFRQALEAQDHEELKKLVRAVTGTDSLDYEDIARAWARENPEELWLKSASISDNQPTRLIRELGRSDVCLVHIATTSSGQQWLCSNTFEEEVVEGRRPYVVRRYHDFPAVGVGPILEGKGPREEPQGLYVMYPRSSFRICRDQRPATLVVAWPGSTLKCFEPRSQSQRNERAA